MKKMCEKLLSLNLAILFFIIILINGFAAYADTAVFAVTYTGNGGVTDGGDSVYIQETESCEDVTLPAYDLFTKEGYEFLYWLGSDGCTYSPGETYTLDEGITMTAHWGYAHITYIVQSPDGSEILNTHIQYIEESGEEIKLTDELICDGYGFTGWNTSPDGSGDAYIAGQVISQYTGRLTLYTQWTPCPDGYIAYSANGSDIFNSESYRYVQVEEFPYTLTLPELADNDNYTYIGWTDDFHTAGSRIYLPGEEITINENIVLNTVYTQNSRNYNYLQAIYNGNGGADSSGTIVRTTLASNGDLVLYEGDIFTRADYDFDGWNTKADGTGTAYEPGGIICTGQAENIRLYAQWKEQTADAKGKVTKCCYSEGYVTANIRLDYIKSECNAVMALYDKEGRLTAVCQKIIGTSDEYIYLSCRSDSGYTEYSAKIFFWSTGSSLLPMGTALETDISEMNAESAHPYAPETDETFIYTYPGECESISITFSESTDTENGYDYIYILDGENTETGVYTGSELSGQTLTISGNTVKIRLTSDATTCKYGYLVENITVNKSQNN